MSPIANPALCLPTMADICAAAERIAPFAVRTPVVTSRNIDRQLGMRIFFKCENLQRAGAFKLRGATNAVFSLSAEEASRGVATHSSGNHGAALALAARERGITAHIVMPRTSVAVKVAAVRGYGGQITFCEPTLPARESTLGAVVEETGATFIHPYRDPRVIAGQGTAALELLADVPSLDLILAPVGGGGLLGGTALCAKAHGVPVIAAEPAGADDAYRSFRAGELIPQTNPKTIADGLLTSLAPITFAILREAVDDVVTVSEAAIVEAMRLVWTRTKLIIEPSAAVPIAALLEGKARAERVGVILSGGNVDLDNLPW